MDVPVFSTGGSVVELDSFNVVVPVEEVVIEEILASIEVGLAVDSSELGGLNNSVAGLTSNGLMDDSSQQL